MPPPLANKGRLFLNIVLRLRVPELRIFALLVREQRRVRSLLDDLPGAEHNDLVAEFAGGEPVRNVNGGLAAHHVVEPLVDLRLGDRVERGGRLVENEERRVLIKRTGNGDLLPLAAGDLDALVVKIAEETRLRPLRKLCKPLAEARLPERRFGAGAVILRRGGDILPTETGFISRKLAKDHWRLGCQVKVKENMKIRVPEAVLGVKKWECTVVSNRNISTFLKEFVVKLPEGENLKFRSGGYIQIDIPKYDAIKFSSMDVDEKFRADWDKFKMWDLVTTNPEPTFRAYSMANHPAEGNIIMLNIRIATPPFDKATGGFMKVNPGICSSYVFSRKPGDKITISGPYGEFFLPDNLPSTQELIFIGGGAGMAPMRSHLMHLFKTEKTDRPVSFWYGARALKEVPYLDEFHQIEKDFPNFSFNLALDRPDPEADAAGVKYTPGFVHNVLYENYLKNHQAPEDCIYLMCGPPMMIASVVKMLDNLGVPPENILYDNFGS